MGRKRSVSSADDAFDHLGRYQSEMYSINKEVSAKLDSIDAYDSRLKSLEKNYQRVVGSGQKQSGSNIKVTTIFEPDEISQTDRSQNYNLDS